MYRRITKPTARKLFNMGTSIYMLPCKCRMTEPESKEFSWVYPAEINMFDSKEDERLFDAMVNAYMYYNCNSELGYYPHYYVSVEEA